jgi:NCAIR mutase (PurE)-related protein
MRDVLADLAAGDCTVAQAESRLRGYATEEAGRFDAAREDRRGIPEAVYGEGKTAAEVAELVAAAVETTGRAIATRVDQDAVTAVEGALPEDASVEHRERSAILVAHAADFEPPDLDATVAVLSAGTADGGPAGEAALTAREIGADVDRIDDIGVASLVRLLDQLDRIREADIVVVAAGREGALPTVVAGLVDAPVIALPIASGYGYGGDGEAALGGALQSCSVLSTVNIDAGFVAGAQAGLIARAIDGARE